MDRRIIEDTFRRIVGPPALQTFVFARCQCGLTGESSSYALCDTVADGDSGNGHTKHTCCYRWDRVAVEAVQFHRTEHEHTDRWKVSRDPMHLLHRHVQNDKCMGVSVEFTNDVFSLLPCDAAARHQPRQPSQPNLDAWPPHRRKRVCLKPRTHPRLCNCRLLRNKRHTWFQSSTRSGLRLARNSS